MAEIKAIETIYNGYRFRSRLEARWAVFFDSAGIEYQYEPEGFELIDGSRYLPDFFLPRIGYYVEVKGFATKDDEKKIRLFSNYCGEYGDYEGKPIIVFGQIPKGWYEITDIAYNPITKDIDVYPFNYEYSRWDHYAALFYKDPCGEIGFSGYDWVKKEDHFPLCFEWVDRHFDKARQARFEHGETPIQRDLPKQTKTKCQENVKHVSIEDIHRLAREAVARESNEKGQRNG